MVRLSVEYEGVDAIQTKPRLGYLCRQILMGRTYDAGVNRDFLSSPHPFDNPFL